MLPTVDYSTFKDIKALGDKTTTNVQTGKLPDSGDTCFFIKQAHTFDDGLDKTYLRIASELFYSEVARAVVGGLVESGHLKVGDIIIPQYGLVMATDTDSTVPIGLYCEEVKGFEPFENIGISLDNFKKIIDCGLGVLHALGYILQDPDRNTVNTGVKDFNDPKKPALCAIDYGLAGIKTLAENSALMLAERYKVAESNGKDSPEQEIEDIERAFPINKESITDGVGRFGEGLFTEIDPLGVYLLLPAINCKWETRVDNNYRERLYIQIYQTFVQCAQTIEPVVQQCQTQLLDYPAFSRELLEKISRSLGERAREIKRVCRLSTRSTDGQPQSPREVVASKVLSESPTCQVFLEVNTHLHNAIVENKKLPNTPCNGRSHHLPEFYYGSEGEGPLQSQPDQRQRAHVDLRMMNQRLAEAKVQRRVYNNSPCNGGSASSAVLRPQPSHLPLFFESRAVRGGEKRQTRQPPVSVGSSSLWSSPR